MIGHALIDPRRLKNWLDAAAEVPPALTAFIESVRREREKWRRTSRQLSKAAKKEELPSA